MNSFVYNMFDFIVQVGLKHEDESIRTRVLKSTQLLTALPAMQEEKGLFKFESDRSIRNGFSSFNVHLAEIIDSNTWGSELDEALKSDEWKSFVDGDVTTQKGLNETVLAGQQS